MRQDHLEMPEALIQKRQLLLWYREGAELFVEPLQIFRVFQETDPQPGPDWGTCIHFFQCLIALPE